MRIRDWSSDVCSSDLLAGDVFERQLIEFETLREQLLDLLDQVMAAQFGQAALGQIFMHFEQVRIPAWRAVVENLRVEPQLAFDGAAADRTAEDLVVLGLRRSEEHTSELQSLMRS